MKLSPLIKGLLTGIIMIGFSLLAYRTLPSRTPLHYLVYALYAIGICWALVSYRQSSSFSGKFGDSFNTGFKCFIIALLCMVVYTYTFSKMHPEFAEESAQLYKEQLLKEKQKMPAEIEEATIRYKKGYTMVLVYGSIFGYLIIGAGVTAAVSALLTRRK